MQLTLENMESYLSLFGMNDRNMAALEQELNVSASLRGQELVLQGDAADVEMAEQVIRKLLEMLHKGEIVDASRIRYAVALAREGRLEEIEEILSDVVAITHRGRRIQCKTLGQREYVNAVRNGELTICVGPAGTGKTYLAMAMAVVALKNKEVERIVLTRPAVEAGERLGFLPGDMTQKVDPYLRPLYDALYEIMGVESYQRMAERGTLEVAPLAFMRGRTLGDAFIILDEAQNTTPEQAYAGRRLYHPGRSAEHYSRTDENVFDPPGRFFPLHRHRRRVADRPAQGTQERPGGGHGGAQGRGRHQRGGIDRPRRGAP